MALYEQKIEVTILVAGKDEIDAYNTASQLCSDVLPNTILSDLPAYTKISGIIVKTARPLV